MNFGLTIYDLRQSFESSASRIADLGTGLWRRASLRRVVRNPQSAIRNLPLLFVLLIFFAGSASADWVLTRTGDTVEGRVVEDGPDRVRVNIHNSDNPRMTYKVVTIPRDQVRKVVIDRPKVQEYLRTASKLKEGEDGEKHYALALWCKEKKLKVQMKERARAALVADPNHEGAKKLLGASAKKFLADRKRFAEEVRPLIEQYALTEDPGARKGLFRKLKSAGFKKPQAYLDRVARSHGGVRGRHLDRKIVFRGGEFPGAVYSLFVPKDYDPLRTWPLVLGLHGGGAAGKDGKEVVGNGPSAMQKYQRECASRGYIIVCPTAVTAPWPNPVNGRFITALLTEIVLSYNVDLNRVYLVGHSMGGGGTWHYGPKWSETFASIAPLAAFGENGMRRLHRNRTGIYIYHGDDDPRCSVGSSRRAATALNKLRADYRYTEIPGSGHSCPMYIVKEVFDFFDTHRLSPAKKPTLFGVRATGRGEHPSFTLPVTPEEKRYLAERKATGVLALVRKLALGGGAAEKAAAEIPKQEDRDRAVSPLRALLARSENEDVRRLAATTLGALGSEKAVPGLGAALDDEVPEVRSAAASALAKIGSEKARDRITRGAALFRKHFEKRIVGKSVMDSVDWEIQVKTLSGYLASAAKAGDGTTAVAVGEHIIGGILLAGIAVDYDREVQPDPRKSRARLALNALKTLEKLGNPQTARWAEKLAEKLKDDAKVKAEAERVASVLKARGD